MMGSQSSTAQTSMPFASTSGNFDRAMPETQQQEPGFDPALSTIPPVSNGASAANSFATVTDQQGWNQTNSDVKHNVEAVLLQLFPPHLGGSPVAACQHLANVLFPLDQGGHPSPLFAQAWRLATTGGLNQDQMLLFKAVSGFQEMTQAPSSVNPVVTSETTNSTPGPIAEVHRFEDGSTFSFAIGTKYRGRRAFQLPAHQIFFDNGYSLVTDRLRTTHYVREPSKSDYPVSGTFELRCSHHNRDNKTHGKPQCPCYIKLRFQLDRVRVPIDEIEFEMVEFVNQHAHHLRGEGLPRTYRPPRIEQEFVKVKIDSSSRSRAATISESDSDSDSATEGKDGSYGTGTYAPKTVKSSPRSLSSQQRRSNTSVGFQVTHRPHPSLFPCSKSSLETLRLRLKGEVGANVAPSGGNPHGSRVRWVCFVGRRSQPHPGGSQCEWTLVFTSQRDAEQWYLSESESHIYHNHPIPDPYGPIPSTANAFDNNALGVFSLPQGAFADARSFSDLEGKEQHGAQPIQSQPGQTRSAIAATRAFDQALVDQKFPLPIETSQRYHERNAPSPEGGASRGLKHFDHLTDQRSSAKHTRSESPEHKTPLKIARPLPSAPIPIEQDAALDSAARVNIQADRIHEAQAAPRTNASEGSNDNDRLETFLVNLAPTFKLSLLGTGTEHNLSILAPSFAALDYSDPESIQNLEQRDLDDLMIELQQHFNEHQKGKSGGIKLLDWKRIANRLKDAFKA